jgi:hypothetical protein
MAEVAYPNEIDRIVEAVLHGPGEVPVAWRQAAAAQAATLSGSELPAPTAPPELQEEPLTSYLATVTLQAHEVTDEDVQRLRGAGLSEDAIFELTVSTALGAALMRLERGLALLRIGELARRDDNHET